MPALKSSTCVLGLLCCALFSCGVLAGDAPSKGGAGKENGRNRGQGQGKAFEFILQHEKDLSLTDEQKKKITELQRKAEQRFEQARKDPDLREPFKQMAEARKSGDADKMAEARQKLKDALDKKPGLSEESLLGDIRNVLTDPQLLKLAELHKEEGGGPKGMRDRKAGKGGKGKGEEEGKRPEPEKGAPSLYE